MFAVSHKIILKLAFGRYGKQGTLVTSPVFRHRYLNIRKKFEYLSIFLKPVLLQCQIVTLMTVHNWTILVKYNQGNNCFKLAVQKKGFFRIVKPFIDMKSQTHTRQNFGNPSFCFLKLRGNRENGMAHEW